MSKYGIDVSRYQSIINWDKVKPQIDFAIIQIGWIGNHDNHTVDLQFERNYKECKRLGIPIGAYIYNYAVSSQNVELAMSWIKKQLSGKTFEMPIYIDMEDNTLINLGKDRLTKLSLTFCKEIENLGFLAGVYANRNWFDNYLNKLEIKNKYNTWIAHYTNAVDKYKGEYDMWQASSKGKINGIYGNVDINYLYKIYNSNQSQNTNLQKTNEEIANEVIEGKWNNGEQRKILLSNAGYNYNEVQSIVNKIMKEKNNINYYKKCDSSFTSLVDALKSIGVDSSFQNRKKIAIANGITNYKGYSYQNINLLNLLKSGALKVG